MVGLFVLMFNLFEICRFVESEGVGIVVYENMVDSFCEVVIDFLN